MLIPRRVALLVLAATLAVSACTPADRVTTAANPSAAAATAGPTGRPSPGTSSRQVTVETPDVGITAARTLADALDRDDRDAAWASLGPRTRAAIGGRDGLSDLGALLAPLTTADTPFDDVIVAQTPRTATHLVVLGDDETPAVAAAEVVRRGDDVTVEVTPPAPSRLRIDVARRRRITISTPRANDIELTVDGFHFHPRVAADGRSAAMDIPFPLSRRRHVLGAWFVGEDTSGVAATVVDTSDD